MIRAEILKKFAASLLLTTMILSAAGCGTAQTGASGSGNSSETGKAAAGSSGEVVITAKDDVFEPTSYSAEAGKPFKLTVVNAGQHLHEVEVKGLLPETKLTPGERKSVDVTAQQAGTFKIYCEIHEDIGMQGELVIK